MNETAKKSQGAVMPTILRGLGEVFPGTQKEGLAIWNAVQKASVKLSAYEKVAFLRYLGIPVSPEIEKYYEGIPCVLYEKALRRALTKAQRVLHDIHIE